MTKDEDAMDLNHDGFAIHPRVVSPNACQSIGQEIDDTFASQSEGAIETSRGGLVGGRNLMTLCIVGGYDDAPTRRPSGDCTEHRLAASVSVAPVCFTYLGRIHCATLGHTLYG